MTLKEREAGGGEPLVDRVQHVGDTALRFDEIDAGRSVIAFMSQVHLDPDLAAEIFVLTPEAEGVVEE